MLDLERCCSGLAAFAYRNRATLGGDMREGDPFETEELDQLRSAQRRHRECVPWELLQSIEAGLDVSRLRESVPGNLGAAEVMLRRLAAERWGQIESLTTRFEEANLAAAAQRVVRYVSSRAEPADPLFEVLRTIGIELDPMATTPSLKDGDDGTVLAEAVVLSALADAVAADRG